MSNLVYTEKLAKLLNGELNNDCPVYFDPKKSLKLFYNLGFSREKIGEILFEMDTDQKNKILPIAKHFVEGNERRQRALLSQIFNSTQYFELKNDDIEIELESTLGWRGDKIENYYKLLADYLNKNSFFYNCFVSEFGCVEIESDLVEKTTLQSNIETANTDYLKWEDSNIKDFLTKEDQAFEKWGKEDQAIITPIFDLFKGKYIKKESDKEIFKYNDKDHRDRISKVLYTIFGNIVK
jgi:hypothetical protein